MSAEKSRPGLVTGATEVLAGGLNNSSLERDASNPAEPAALIGFTVEKPLMAALWKYRTGEITLADLTPSLAEWFLEGHRAALMSVLPELTRAELERDQANSDADRLHGHLYSTPKKIDPNRPSYAELQSIRAEQYIKGTR